MNHILRCPDCNTPLIPGSTSCIKCNKQFSEPIPKIAEPKPAEQSIAPISVTLIATPLKSSYKPQSKFLFAIVPIVGCLIALVAFIVNQSQADEREALAQKQAYQQVLQNRTQLQQETIQEANRISQPPPRHVYAPAPVVVNAPSPTPDVITSQQGSIQQPDSTFQPPISQSSQSQDSPVTQNDPNSFELDSLKQQQASLLNDKLT